MDVIRAAHARGPFPSDPDQARPIFEAAEAVGAAAVVDEGTGLAVAFVGEGVWALATFDDAAYVPRAAAWLAALFAHPCTRDSVCGVYLWDAMVDACGAAGVDETTLRDAVDTGAGAPLMERAFFHDRATRANQASVAAAAAYEARDGVNAHRGPSSDCRQ